MIWSFSNYGLSLWSDKKDWEGVGVSIYTNKERKYAYPFRRNGGREWKEWSASSVKSVLCSLAESLGQFGTFCGFLFELPLTVTDAESDVFKSSFLSFWVTAKSMQLMRGVVYRTDLVFPTQPSGDREISSPSAIGHRRTSVTSATLCRVTWGLFPFFLRHVRLVLHLMNHIFFVRHWLDKYMGALMSHWCQQISTMSQQLVLHYLWTLTTKMHKHGANMNISFYFQSLDCIFISGWTVLRAVHYLLNQGFVEHTPELYLCPSLVLCSLPSFCTYTFAITGEF